jgi:HlyD family secretion protein
MCCALNRGLQRLRPVRHLGRRLPSVRLPSVRLPRALAGLAVVLLATVTSAQSKPPAQSKLPPVVVAPVIDAEVNSAQRIVGTVNPLRTSIIGSAVAGRVETMDIDLGDAVATGATLATLRKQTMELEKAAAEAERDLALYQLNELKNGPLPEDVAEAEALALGAKSAMENAATSLRRLRSLVASGASTAADIEDATERAAISTYAFKAAEASRRRTEQGPRAELIEQAQARLGLQEQNVLLIEDRIDKLDIRSPFDGFVAAKFTEVGAWINVGDPIAQVIQLDYVEVQAPTTADYAVKLKRGDMVRVEFPELPHKLWTGVVHRVVPVADTRARTYPVTIRLQNEIVGGSPLLLSGMLARVDLAVGSPVTLPLVPKDAVVLNERERAVFVVEPSENGATESGTTEQVAPKKGIVRKVPVQLGVAVGGMIQVIGNIKAGQYVVALGNERLTDGSEVEVSEVLATEELRSASR